jgi:hypothetical protein
MAKKGPAEKSGRPGNERNLKLKIEPCISTQSALGIACEFIEKKLAKS